MDGGKDMKICLDYINQEMYEETKKESSIHRKLDVELGKEILSEAYILPNFEPWKDGKCYGGIVDADGNFKMSSAWHEGARCDAYDFDRNSVDYLDMTIVYMGILSSCWGHAITDNLKKLWYLKTDECSRYVSDGAKVVYLTIGNSEMPQYVHELLELAGAKLCDMTKMSSITKVKTIILPDNSFVADNGQRYFTETYRNTINEIKSRIRYNQSKIDKIYFTRTKVNDWRDYGEAEIEEVFRKKGYTIISPEQHGVGEQISMMMSCRHFAATEGSVSHNVVFCEPGTEVTIIRKVNDVNKYQMAVNEVADVDVTYVDAHNSVRASKKAPWGGPFFMCINRNIERYCGQQIFHLPLWMRISWWEYLYYDNRIVKGIKRRLS